MAAPEGCWCARGADGVPSFSGLGGAPHPVGAQPAAAGRPDATAAAVDKIPGFGVVVGIECIQGKFRVLEEFLSNRLFEILGRTSESGGRYRECRQGTECYFFHCVVWFVAKGD